MKKSLILLISFIATAESYAALISGGVSNDCIVTNRFGPTYFCSDGLGNFASADVRNGELKLNRSQGSFDSIGIRISEIFQFDLRSGFSSGTVSFTMLLSGQVSGDTRATAEMAGSTRNRGSSGSGDSSTHFVNSGIGSGSEAFIFGENQGDGRFGSGRSFTTRSSATIISNQLIDYTFTGSRQEFESKEININFDLNCTGSGDCFLGNTAYFDVDLSEGLIWSNRDNIFLINPQVDRIRNSISNPTDVPEPNAVILLSTTWLAKTCSSYLSWMN